MNWTNLHEQWHLYFEQFKQRFPYAAREPEEGTFSSHEAFVQYIARSHGLTVAEAFEELEDWLFVQTLHRDVA